MTAAEDRVPVLVAAGQSIERDAVVSGLELAARAAGNALERVPRLRPRIQHVSVVNIMSKVGPAPASELARRLGLSPRRAEVTTIGGNTPQWLVNRAAAAIASGRLDAALVVGAEAQRSARPLSGTKARSPRPARSEPSDRDEPTSVAASPPDPVVGDDRAGIGAAEMNAALLAPVHVYALFESVIAERAGRALAEHRAALGTLMARFTRVAAKHPYAWFPEERSATELSEPGPDNRLVSEPYPKRMCAVLGVDLGAAVVMTSLAAARAAGCADRAVFCWSGAEANDVWFPSARPDLGRSPALRAAATAALAVAGLDIDVIDAFDLYSCFPCAVEMAIDALGLASDDPRGFTVTGGLPYFGGPGNNYSLHAIATMADRLREQGGLGFVNALGWYVTKHAVGVYGATPPPSGWRSGDTSGDQRTIDASAVEVAVEADGPGRVLASTVAYDPHGRVSAAPVIARLHDGRHIAAAAAEDELGPLAGRSLVGEPVHIWGSPPRYRLDG